tara:strand:+ start:58 stop:2211 length:2154 start_codon:yes stop_codon:yes gene_type:complete
MDEIDFNVDNYDIDELIQLLNFDTTPTNEDMILHKITFLTKRYKEKPKYIKFFNEIGKKLILNFEQFNKETWQESYETDESLSAKVLTQQYLDIEKDSKNLILDKNRDIIGIKKVSETKTFATKNNTQGERNPVMINQIRRIVNFDSQYREILNPISSTCTDINGNYTTNGTNINNINHVNPEIRLFHPTNYTVNLNQPLINVVDLSLESVEIPNSWYVFSGDYGTNALEFTYIKKDEQLVADIYLPTIPTTYTLIVESLRNPENPSLRDPQIGITNSVKTENIVWLSSDDDSGPGLLSKLSFTSLTENTVYELWVGEYKTNFIDRQNPSTVYKNEVGSNWRIRIKIQDGLGNSLPGFTDIIIDGVIPADGVGLAKTFIINYVSPNTIYETKKIAIEDGNYQPDELMYAINNLCVLNYIPVEFSYSSINGKTSITNTNNNKKTIIKFYIEDAESSGCSAQKTLNEEGSDTPNPGNKIGYNLGWLLGFRVKTLELSPSEKTSGKGLLDTFGPKYFILTLDDFNNNKPNKDLISLVDNSAKNFKLPDYYNSQTMDSRFGDTKYYPGHSASDVDAADWICQDTAGPPAKRGCSENELNTDLRSNLTKKQQYTVDQLTLANTSGGNITLDDGSILSTVVNRYRSPNSSDLLVRIPITTARQEYTKSIVFRNENPEYTKRIYFGPVKLRKFKIRLLNDKGFEVNLNDQDWSFSIHVTQLYQF